MADQQAPNEAAFDLILVIGLKAGEANNAVNYYHEVFGAEKLDDRSDEDMDDPHLEVLLQFGSIKISLTECHEEELANVRNFAIQLVYEGEPDTVITKALQNGGTAITDTLETGEFLDNDLPFLQEGKDFCKAFKDPFGVIWTIVGNKIVTETEESSSDYTSSSGTTGSDDTNANQTGSDDNNAPITGSNDPATA